MIYYQLDFCTLYTIYNFDKCKTVAFIQKVEYIMVLTTIYHDAVFYFQKQMKGGERNEHE